MTTFRAMVLASAASLLIVSPAVAVSWSLEVAGGLESVDRALADFNWDTRPRSSWGIGLWRQAGPAALGVRATHASSVHRVPELDPLPRIRQWNASALVRWPLVKRGGFALHAGAEAGATRLTWSPARAEIETVGGPVAVDFAPIVQWSGGVLMAMTQEMANEWNLAVELGQRVHPLDTMHRSGDEVIEERRYFGTWGLRIALGRTLARG